MIDALVKRISVTHKCYEMSPYATDLTSDR
jgi:hypothetical protein